MEKTTKMITIKEVVSDINSGKIVLDTSAQQRTVEWDDNQKGKYIYTILDVIPAIDIYYTAIEQDGKSVMSIIDGRQVLLAFADFLNNKIIISEDVSSVYADKPLNLLCGKKFSQLPSDKQEFLENLSLKFITISL